MKRIFWNAQERRLRAFWRIVIQLLLMVMGVLAGSLLLGIVYGVIQFLAQNIPATNLESLLQSAGLNAITGIITLIATLLSMGIVGYFIDRRRLGDFGFDIQWGWLLDVGFGLALGALLMTGVFLLEWALGWIEPAFTFTFRAPYLVSITAQIVLFLCVGIYEEALSRGYQLRNLAEGLNWPKLGPRGAILSAWVLTSVLFGLAHAGNPNATFISTFNIVLAGLFLGLGYILTGELAIPIGLHITWNLFQGTVFGFPVSGGAFGASIVTIQQQGPTAWTGGAFGPEAGLMGILAMVTGSLLTLLWVRLRQGKLSLREEIAEYTPHPGKSTPPAPPVARSENQPEQLGPVS